MQVINIKNKEILLLLNDFSSWFKNLDKSVIKLAGEAIKKNIIQKKIILNLLIKKLM